MLLWLLLLAMTYLVKQKIRGRIYAYEAENFWDPEKKQSRQKRRYLGVWDESTSQIIPKTAERDVKATKSFGPAYLLNSIGDKQSISSGESMPYHKRLIVLERQFFYRPQREVGMKCFRYTEKGMKSKRNLTS